jgi:hypothetical protein
MGQRHAISVTMIFLTAFLLSSVFGPASSRVAAATVPLFQDGFETGDLSQWSSKQGLVVQSQEVASGSYAARATSAAGASLYARKTLSSVQSNLYYRIAFKILSQTNTTVNLLKLRTAADAPILSLSVSNVSKLSYRNDVAGTSINSSTTVSPGVWHTVQVHVGIAGASSQTEVWYDDVRIDGLSRTEALGTANRPPATRREHAWADL